MRGYTHLPDLKFRGCTAYSSGQPLLTCRLSQLNNQERTLYGALDFAGTQTSCTYLNMGGGTVYNGANTLEVWFPGTLGADMGVTDIHSG